MTDLFSGYFLLSAVIFLLGLYTVISQENLVKIVIGLEIMGKGILLVLITAGFSQGNTGTAQAIAITAILIDAVLLSVILAFIVNVFRHTGNIQADRIAGARE